MWQKQIMLWRYLRKLNLEPKRLGARKTDITRDFQCTKNQHHLQAGPDLADAKSRANPLVRPLSSHYYEFVKI